MRHHKDLTGKRFGKLLAFGFAGICIKTKGAVWHCHCDCGQFVPMLAVRLVHHGKTHCGCENKPVDLTGAKFGRLTVKRLTATRNTTQERWLSVCDCGREDKSYAHQLLDGERTQCKTCRAIERNGKEICTECSKEFVLFTSHKHTGVCSSKCYWKKIDSLGQLRDRKLAGLCHNYAPRGPYTCTNPACAAVYETKCGKTDGRGRPQGHKYCSRECSWQHQAKLSASKRKRDIAEIVSVQVSTRTLSWFKCAYCNAKYVTNHRAQDKFCSVACSRRFAKALVGRTHKKRAEHYGVTYEPVNKLTVFERCDWKCKHCDVDTPRSLMGTLNANAPELDHILPLSKGGTHSYFNTQLLCRSCNGAKGDRIESEPLLCSLSDEELAQFKSIGHAETDRSREEGTRHCSQESSDETAQAF